MSTYTIPDTPGTRQFVQMARVDRQYAAAYFLLSRLRWDEKRHAAFSYITENGIEKGKLLRAIRAWSHGEQIIVKVALDLFDPGCVRQNRARVPDVGEIAGVLDSGHMRDVIGAIRIARGEFDPDPEAIP